MKTNQNAYIRGFSLFFVLLALVNCNKNTSANSNSNQDVAIKGEVPLLVSKAQPEPAKQKTLQEIYREVAPLLTTSMLTCPDKIWDGYSWKNFSVLMLETGKPALHWDGSKGTLESIDETSVPSISYSGVFNFFPWQGHKAASLYLQDAPYFQNTLNAFQLAVHEGFHREGQEGWVHPSGDRGTVYPVEAQPRIYRHALFKNLKQYFYSNGKDSQSLSKAAYWYNKWVTEYPQEALSTTDGYEGTARYVEYMATVVAQNGCQASEEVFLKAAQDLIAKKNMNADLTPDNMSLDSEGYSVGGMASFILRLLSQDKTWYTEVKNGNNPLDVLLLSVSEKEDSVEKTVEQSFQDAATRMNIELAALFGKDLENYSKPEYVHVNLTGEFASFSPQGFFLPKAKPGMTIIPLALELPTQGSDWLLTIAANTVLFSVNETPCGYSFFTALVPKSEFKTVNNVLTINSSGLSGSMPGEVKTDAQGITWFCGK